MKLKNIVVTTSLLLGTFTSSFAADVVDSNVNADTATTTQDSSAEVDTSLDLNYFSTPFLLALGVHLQIKIIPGVLKIDQVNGT